MALILKLRESIKVNLTLVILSTFLTLLPVEILLFCLGPPVTPATKHIHLASKQGIPFDLRTDIEFLADLRRYRTDAYLFISGGSFLDSKGIFFEETRLYPLSTISNAAIVLCNESGKWVVLQSDEHGFNNPPGSYEHEKIDMVLIGDSFSMGSCVKQGEELGQYLRTPHRKVLNFGMAGLGPLLEFAVFTEYAKRFQPKTLLWIYYEGNDILDLEKEQQVPILRRYLEADFSQKLFERQAEIDRALINTINAIQQTRYHRQRQDVRFQWSNWGRIFRFFYLRQWVKSTLQKRRGDQQSHIVTQPQAPLPDLLRQILMQAKAQVSSWDGRLYFVYLPTWARYSGLLQGDNLFLRHSVLTLVRDLDIPLIDIHPVFAQHPDPLSLFPFRLHAHYTSQAYGLIAEEIERHLALAPRQ